MQYLLSSSDEDEAELGRIGQGHTADARGGLANNNNTSNVNAENPNAAGGEVEEENERQHVCAYSVQACLGECLSAVIGFSYFLFCFCFFLFLFLFFFNFFF